MTARINIALDINGTYVKIQEAVSGQFYTCINCGERLIANKGNKNIPFYRHYNAQDRETLIECELYASGDSDSIVLMNEQLYENKVRFVVDDSFNLKVKFPYLSSSSISRMNFDDLYFFIKVENRKIFSAELGKMSNDRFIEVAIKDIYNIEIENERNARLLDYDIQSHIQLFHSRALIFKKINGEFINIPYEKTNLSDEFFLFTKKKIHDHSDLIRKNDSVINGVYTYHFYIEELTESLIRWFKINTGYTIIPHRKWIDMIYPNSFEFENHKIIVCEEEVHIKVTPISAKDNLIFTDIDDNNKRLSVHESGIVKIKLVPNHPYHITLNHEISNELTIEYKQEINPHSSFVPTIMLNDQLEEIMTRSFSEPYSIESAERFYVFNRNEYPVETKSIQGELPTAIHFPFLGTMYKKEMKKEEDLINLELLRKPTQWLLVNHREFIEFFYYVQQSNIPNRSLYINKLLENYNKLPKEIISVIRGGN